MSSSVIVGTQWGDEGKGKIIDVMAAKADVVVRSSGGNNAGHTVVHGDQVYKLHLLPSGILYPETFCLIGSGVVVDPAVLLEEIKNMNERGVTCDNLRIDARADIIMPWHRLLDKLSEEFKAKQTGVNIGTTGRGIGPCYTDKDERIGIRMYDLVHPEVLKKKIQETGELKNLIITKVYGGEACDLDAIYEEYKGYGEKLAKYMADASVITFEAYQAGKNVLFEGAQATLLDIDFGTYPFVTSSHPIAGGACVGTGVGPKMIDEVIGVVKAYSTCVGEGPFVCEMFGAEADALRKAGFEYGAKTGRPRRVGPIDLVATRYGVQVQAATNIALTKLDVLSYLDKIPVCAHYELNGEVIDEFPFPTLQSSAKPVMEYMEGWKCDISGVRKWEDLPEAARNYVQYVEEKIGCRIGYVSVGPERDSIIIR